jgi:hypothetical protein
MADYRLNDGCYPGHSPVGNPSCEKYDEYMSRMHTAFVITEPQRNLFDWPKLVKVQKWEENLYGERKLIETRNYRVGE